GILREGLMPNPPNIKPTLPYPTPGGGEPSDQASNYGLLANYFGSGPSISNLAKYIVLNAQTNAPLGPGGTSPTGANQPSLMSRIFDVLSRGNYASANFVDDLVKSGSPHLQALWEGLSGQKKTTYSKVLEDLGVDNPVQKGVEGFALDVLADPTTYIP